VVSYIGDVHPYISREQKAIVLGQVEDCLSSGKSFRVSFHHIIKSLGHATKAQYGWREGLLMNDQWIAKACGEVIMKVITWISCIGKHWQR
jgi:hypothetical protein